MNKELKPGEVHGRGSFYNGYPTTKPRRTEGRKQTIPAKRAKTARPAALKVAFYA
jgi:hypothetical protein